MLFAFPHQPDAPNPLYLQCHRKQFYTVFHSISVGYVGDIEPVLLSESLIMAQTVGGGDIDMGETKAVCGSRLMSHLYSAKLPTLQHTIYISDMFTAPMGSDLREGFNKLTLDIFQVQ